MDLLGTKMNSIVHENDWVIIGTIIEPKNDINDWVEFAKVTS
jgi:hypothetical protein